jgi:glucoamylase
MLLQTLSLACVVLPASAITIPIPHLDRFLGLGYAQKQQQPLQDTLDTWIQREVPIALDQLLANVAPWGRNVKGKGVAPGTVIASPSTAAPDYWYQCKRIVSVLSRSVG